MRHVVSLVYSGVYFHYDGVHILIFKNRKFSKVLLYVFALLMKQTAQVRSSFFVEKLIIYSWVAGAMMLCLSYDSAFLFFLPIPPFSKNKHLPDLASASQDEYYHCLILQRIPRYLWDKTCSVIFLCCACENSEPKFSKILF